MRLQTTHVCNGPHPAQRASSTITKPRLLHADPLCFACFTGRTAALPFDFTIPSNYIRPNSISPLSSPPKHFQSWNSPKHHSYQTTSRALKENNQRRTSKTLTGLSPSHQSMKKPSTCGNPRSRNSPLFSFAPFRHTCSATVFATSVY